MARYKKRTDGRYQANVFIGMDEDTGIRKYETVYASKISELENKKADIRDKVNKGIYANDQRMTVKVWAKKWFETEKSICGIRNKEMYELLVNTHIIPALGDIRLKDLKKSDVQLMINQRADRPRTCQQLRMATRQMLDSAIEDGLIYKNVATKVNLPPRILEEKRPLTDIEKKAIEKTVFTEKEKVFVYILLHCGLRRGEILALSRADISLSANNIKVSKAVTFDKGKAVLKQMPKTYSGFRTVPITDKLNEILTHYLKSLNGLYLFEMERKDGLMSKSSYDKFWSHVIEKINAAAGGNERIEVIDGLTAHVFRHNYATMLYYAGVKPKDAQYLLGHSDIRLTLDIYTHLDEQQSSAGDKLNAFLAL